MKFSTPRLLVAGLRGGGGKTFVAVGLAAAFRARGLKVAVFKKGPDYIDAAWLSRAAGVPCRNLDLFLMKPEVVRRSFAAAAADADLAVLEGNRGLYDGVDEAGTYSAAELAKLLRAPVLLTADCTKATRTIAAAVFGCMHLDRDVPLRGVVLNRVSGRRHESVLRASVAKDCGLPVVGAVPCLKTHPFPERHLGLVPPPEHDAVRDAVEETARVIAERLDLDAVLRLAREAPPLEIPPAPVVSAALANPAAPVVSAALAERPGGEDLPVRLAVFRDEAFQFYYPESLEALTAAGATLVETSPLRDAEPPAAEAFYIGGGFPEMLAAPLAANVSFRRTLRRLIEQGTPVYAECGGVVYLGEKLLLQGKEYPLTGALPVVSGFGPKPRGHGYVVLETVAENPFFPVGETVRGHEFHYTHPLEFTDDDLHFAFRVQRGHGFDGERDGLCRGNVLASYTHIHALGVKAWAESFVARARLLRKGP